jgi:hypothetical protein
LPTTWCSRWSQPHDALGSKEPTIDYCKHNGVDIETNEDHHAIGCNQCGRWWRCYGGFADIWADFIRYGRMDGSDPPTVNIVCSTKDWPTSGNEVEDAGFEEYHGRYGRSVLYRVS